MYGFSKVCGGEVEVGLCLSQSLSTLILVAGSLETWKHITQARLEAPRVCRLPVSVTGFKPCTTAAISLHGSWESNSGPQACAHEAGVLLTAISVYSLRIRQALSVSLSLIPVAVGREGMGN